MIQEAYEYVIRSSVEFWSVVFYSACSDPRSKMEEGEFWFLFNQTTKYKMHYLIYYVVWQGSRTSAVRTKIMPPAITYCYSYLQKQQKDARIPEHWIEMMEIAKKLTHLLPFWNTDQNMCCKIPLTKIVNWTVGCEPGLQAAGHWAAGYGPWSVLGAAGRGQQACF